MMDVLELFQEKEFVIINSQQINMKKRVLDLIGHVGTIKDLNKSLHYQPKYQNGMTADQF